MGTDDTGDEGGEGLRDVYGPGQPEEPGAPTEAMTPVVSGDTAPASEPPPPPVDDPTPAGPTRLSPLVGALIVAAVVGALLALFLVTKDDDPALTAQSATTTTFDDDSLGTTTTAPSTTTTLALTVEEAPATTVTTAVATTVVRTASVGCPQSVGSSVDRFAWEQEAPGSDVYLLDVRGTVTNGGGSAIRVASIEIAVLRGGTQVASMTVPANQTVGPGEVLEYFRDDAPVNIPGGAPDAARVSSVPYTCA